MSIIEELALGTASSATKKAILPWVFVAALLALVTTGVSGMYAGYEIATGRQAKDKEAMVNAYAEASDAKNEALKEARKRGDDAAGTFLEALRGIRIVNTTINKEVQRETQKLVYTDCKLPDTGIDLLQRHIDAVNLKLVGGDKK